MHFGGNTFIEYVHFNIFGSLMLFYLIIILASSETKTFFFFVFYEADNQ